MKLHFALEENSVLVGNNHQTSNVYANMKTLLDATLVSFLFSYLWNVSSDSLVSFKITVTLS